MAMNIDTGLLESAIRHEGDGSPHRIYRYKMAVQAYLDHVTEDLPEAIQSVAVEMACAWLLDRPQASSGRQSYSDVFAMSGCNALISPWRVSRLLPAKNVNEVQ